MALHSLFRKKSVADIQRQIAENGSDDGHGSLGRHLGVRDLTAFGIAAIIGAGIFSTIGLASYDGGPAVIFLFIFTAIACGFAAFAYAEFASMVPVSGSAYTYSYVAFGEIIAWIIGWALIMEYAIGNITVAISWSNYFTGFLENLHIDWLGLKGIHLPAWSQMDYVTASKGYHEAMNLLSSGKNFANLEGSLQEAYYAWTSAPKIGSFHLVADLPALFIIVLITWLVYRGMKESRNASNVMVVIKLAIILLVIAVGIFYIDTANWDPFAPNGVGGILKGVSAVFFAYIGFDAISTTAEECKNPQRDLPRGMMWAIIICTILYVIIALVLTGMVSYESLNVADPLAFVFQKLDLTWLSGIIAVSAVIAMASVLLVFQMGQPRIWMSMSRDGLLPKKFSRIHPKHKTPSYATVVVGFVVAVPALFLNITDVTDLCSIGTLFAFVVVCAGVLVLQNKKDIPRGKFKTPYINGKFVMPVLVVVAIVLTFTLNKDAALRFLKNEPQLVLSEDLIASMNEKQLLEVKTGLEQTDRAAFEKSNSDVEAYLGSLEEEKYKETLGKLNVGEEQMYHSGFSLFSHKIPMYIFFIIVLLLTYFSITHNLSLIPMLGLVSCLYMMCELKLSNWIGFGIWLLVGLVIYFLYGKKHSKLNTGEIRE
ncbi:MAG: Amino acid permease [Crocinitomicaceae bacterium]|jgi:amino acid transporter|nr:Amino acid permease [Crocinitomicaceae bacterium]